VIRALFCKNNNNVLVSILLSHSPAGDRYQTCWIKEVDNISFKDPRSLSISSRGLGQRLIKTNRNFHQPYVSLVEVLEANPYLNGYK
jgi:hypothetical protein